MKESRTREIRAMVTLDKNLIAFSGIPIFLAKDEKELETITGELGKLLSGEIYGLSNGVKMITESK